MRVNSISSFNYKNNNLQSFKHTAVPYPEYEGSYNQNDKSIYKIDVLINKISDLFHPEVSKSAREIKSQIDKICEDNSPKDSLMSVLA